MAVLKENRKGFTLIELLVVAALLFVVLSIAVPRFSMLFSIRENRRSSISIEIFSMPGIPP